MGVAVEETIHHVHWIRWNRNNKFSLKKEKKKRWRSCQVNVVVVVQQKTKEWNSGIGTWSKMRNYTLASFTLVMLPLGLCCVKGERKPVDTVYSLKGILSEWQIYPQLFVLCTKKPLVAASNYQLHWMQGFSQNEQGKSNNQSYHVWPTREMRLSQLSGFSPTHCVSVCFSNCPPSDYPTSYLPSLDLIAKYIFYHDMYRNQMSYPMLI